MLAACHACLMSIDFIIVIMWIVSMLLSYSYTFIIDRAYYTL
jgi:hypothetical protein